MKRKKLERKKVFTGHLVGPGAVLGKEAKTVYRKQKRAMHRKLRKGGR